MLPYTIELHCPVRGYTSILLTVARPNRYWKTLKWSVCLEKKQQDQYHTSKDQSKLVKVRAQPYCNTSRRGSRQTKWARGFKSQVLAKQE